MVWSWTKQPGNFGVFFLSSESLAKDLKVLEQSGKILGDYLKRFRIKFSDVLTVLATEENNWRAAQKLSELSVEKVRPINVDILRKVLDTMINYKVVFQILSEKGEELSTFRLTSKLLSSSKIKRSAPS